MRVCLQLAIAILGIAILADDAAAAIQVYELSNHPLGNARPPQYGLRLDNLQNRGGVYTFDFDAPGASVFLTYDDDNGGVNPTITITGTNVLGGRDTGNLGNSDDPPTDDPANVYDTENSGRWDFNFVYRVGVQESGGGLIVSPDDPQNNGTISLVSGNWIGDTQSTYNMVDYQGGHANSFLFLPDGHRIPGDNSTLVGRGWMNHDGDGSLSVHNTASDWLFTGELVPEPATFVVWGGLAAIGMVMIRRRNR